LVGEGRDVIDRRRAPTSVASVVKGVGDQGGGEGTGSWKDFNQHPLNAKGRDRALSSPCEWSGGRDGLRAVRRNLLRLFTAGSQNGWLRRLKALGMFRESACGSLK